MAVSKQAMNQPAKSGARKGISDQLRLPCLFQHKIHEGRAGRRSDVSRAGRNNLTGSFERQEILSANLRSRIWKRRFIRAKCFVECVCLLLESPFENPYIFDVVIGKYSSRELSLGVPTEIGG